MKRNLAVILILCLMLLIGNAFAESPTVVTSRWAGPHADDQKEILKNFTEVNVKVDDIDYGNLKQKQIQSLSSSAEYDLIWASEVWFPEYVGKGWLLPLNDLVEKTQTDLSIYSPGMLAASTIDGKLYGIPDFAQTLVLTYNKEWFDREGLSVPKTMEELLETAKYFKDKGTGIGIPATQGQASVDLFAQLLYTLGGDYFDENGALTLASPQAVEAATIYDQLCEYAAIGSLTWHHDQVSEAIRMEKIPFGITVTGLSGLDIDPEQSLIADKVGYAPIPGPGGSPTVGISSTWTWCIAANSKNPDAAFKALMWLCGYDATRAQTLKNGQISAITALGEDPEVVSSVPVLPAASITLSSAKTQPTSVEASVIFNPLIVTLSNIASTDVSPSDAMNLLQDELKDVHL